MPKRGKYIVIEGGDGTGKTTQVNMLLDYLKSKQITAIAAKEPGGTPIGEKIREILVDKNLQRQPLTNVMLYTASRVESWQEAEKQLATGTWVVSSRNYYSSLVYQGIAEGVDVDLIADLTAKIMGQRYTNPDQAIILVAQKDERIVRLNQRTGNNLDYFESKSEAFQHKIDSGYQQIAKKLNLPTVDAHATPEEVHQQIVDILKI